MYRTSKIHLSQFDSCQKIISTQNICEIFFDFLELELHQKISWKKKHIILSVRFFDNGFFL